MTRLQETLRQRLEFGSYPTTPQVDPSGLPAGTERVLGGGAWIILARDARCPPQLVRLWPLLIGDERQPKDPVETTNVAGFLVADTACIQALWPAVMGGNPSRLGEDNTELRASQQQPVEQVRLTDIALPSSGFVHRLQRFCEGCAPNCRAKPSQEGVRLPRRHAYPVWCGPGPPAPLTREQTGLRSNKEEAHCRLRSPRFGVHSPR